MGKIRVATLGSTEEAEQKRKADARRQTKKSKKPFDKAQGKVKVEGVGLHGGERTVAMEGVDLKPEVKKVLAEIESGESQDSQETQDKKARKKARQVKQKSKKYQKVASLVDKNKLYPIKDAVELVKKTSVTKFDGTVELHVTLRPEVLGDTKSFRGSVRLPHATGRIIKVAIADEALIATIEAGKIDFDILVAHPSMMAKLAKHAKVLGPKGLMPNPKNGTVTENPEKRAKELAGGEVNFKNEPEQPLLHLVAGKVSQPDKELVENVDAYLSAINRSKILRVTLSATMGPGIKVAL